MKRRIWQTGCRISKQRVIAQVIWERLQGGDREGGVAQEAAPGTRHMHQPACYYAVQDSLSSTWYLYSNILWMMLFSNEPASIPSTCYYTVLGTMLACCTWYDDYLELEQVGSCLVLVWFPDWLESHRRVGRGTWLAWYLVRPHLVLSTIIQSLNAPEGPFCTRYHAMPCYRVDPLIQYKMHWQDHPVLGTLLYFNVCANQTMLYCGKIVR